MTAQSQLKGAYISSRDKYLTRAVKTYIEDGGTLKEGLRIFYDAFNLEIDDCGPIAKTKPKPSKPTIVPQEQLDRRREEELRRKERVAELAAKYSTSFGVPWGDIGWHELPSMGRDGEVARAIAAAGPAHVPNDGRRVRDVLATNKLHSVIDEARKAMK